MKFKKEEEKAKERLHIRKRSLGPRDFPPPRMKSDPNPISPRLRQLGPRDFKRDPSFGKEDITKRDPTKTRKIRKATKTEKAGASKVRRAREERRPGSYRPNTKYKPYKPSDTKVKTFNSKRIL